jgi:hypothetical protein
MDFCFSYTSRVLPPKLAYYLIGKAGTSKCHNAGNVFLIFLYIKNHSSNHDARYNDFAG